MRRRDIILSIQMFLSFDLYIYMYIYNNETHLTCNIFYFFIVYLPYRMQTV